MAFKGKRVLVVEDELLVALGLREELRALGCTVVGPAASLSAAMRAAAHETMDAAILDINLAGERVYPAADILYDRGVPFLFCSGQPPNVPLPQRLCEAPRMFKPYTSLAIASALADLMSVEPEERDHRTHGRTGERGGTSASNGP